jgi:hypothetical protein
VFQLAFLFGIIGLSSPFQYLPDQGFGYFLKNPWTNQAFGICMEALIVALAVISRDRWLQSKLNLTAKKPTEVIEQQNVEPCAEIIRALQSSIAEWQGSHVRRDDLTVVLFKL